MSDSTPPNWPIHDVFLTDEQISDVIVKVYTGSRLNRTTNLGKKKSFNNRIYFVHIEHESHDVDLPTEVVLKVNGRFFGSSKVQNEVASLLLLEQFCPDIPALRVLAWSEDGSKICAVRNGVFAVLYDKVIDPDDSPKQVPAHGWIMTTKLPGRTLQASDLYGNDELIGQLADIVASWRTNIPPRTEIGNLALQPAGYTSSNTLYGLEFKIGGLILCESQALASLESSAAYYTQLLEDQIQKIATKEVFSYSRSRLLENLQRFQTATLPQLLQPLDSAEDIQRSIFTQQDFAPRNILVDVSDAGILGISGIVDFEFAGFFPAAEEFLNCTARQSGDWPVEIFEDLCAALSSRGISAPGLNSETGIFEILKHLVVLTENVAPWWLENGHITGDELEVRLAEACELAEDVIEKLSKSYQ